jgi:hypothetical protein
MEIITTTEEDILTVLPDKDGKIRLTINKICVVMPPMTAAIVCVAIQQILRGTYKKKRNTKRPQ